MSNIGSSIYHGAIELERGKTFIGAICATLIGMCICSVGIYLFTRKTATTQATVKDVSCTVVEGKTTCNVTINYLVEGNSYTTTTTSPSSYSIGTVFTIIYDTANPQSVTLPNGVSNSVAGMGSMACAVCIVIMGWSWWYITNKYESVAVVQAVGDTLSILRR